MKNTIKLIGIIAIVAIIGFSFIACPTGSTDPEPDSLDGTWIYFNDPNRDRITINEYTWVYDMSNNSGSTWTNGTKGTFAISGNDIHFTYTHNWNGSAWVVDSSGTDFATKTSTTTFVWDGDTYTKQP